jgi:hypothetical protein
MDKSIITFKNKTSFHILLKLLKLFQLLIVLGVMFDSKLSRGSHITHISKIVKKKIHDLRQFSTDFIPSKLLGIDCSSIFSILCYAAGTWLNGDLQEKLFSRLKVLSNSTLQIVLRKRRQEWRCLELHSLSKMPISSHMETYYPGFFAKSCGL